MQTRIDCGPVAAMQVLEYIGRPVARETLLRLWRFNPTVDCTDTPGHHLRVMRRLGVEIQMARGLDLSDLRRACALSFPVVMLVRVGPFQWHWVVLAGFEGETAVVSWGRPERAGGAGTVRRLSPGELALVRAPSALCRLLRLDRLAYVLRPAGGACPPWTTPPDLAAWHGYLAAFGESLVLEPLLRLVGYAGPGMTRPLD
jgi:hypothetical protein